MFPNPKPCEGEDGDRGPIAKEICFCELQEVFRYAQKVMFTNLYPYGGVSCQNISYLGIE